MRARSAYAIVVVAAAFVACGELHGVSDAPSATEDDADGASYTP
jgi:hypothetical protein